MPEPERYYKVLNADGTSCNGGTGRWPLPAEEQPGEWVRVEPPLVPCEHGLHLCRRDDLVVWLGPMIYVAEVHPEAERVTCDDKVVVARARLLQRVDAWTERTARLFAADCAERALAAERAAGREPDPRSWAAIDAARDYAEGRIDATARSAARSAAWSAAESVGWSAAESAARSAAWSAARSAAESAARSAAESAAESAARSAVRSAAWSAARTWQTERLWWYLNGADNA